MFLEEHLFPSSRLKSKLSNVVCLLGLPGSKVLAFIYGLLYCPEDGGSAFLQNMSEVLRD
jgi:hypothetical protein